MTPTIEYTVIAQEDIPQVIDLLNCTVSFGLATRESVTRRTGSSWSLLAKLGDKVIGIISAERVVSLDSELNYHADLVTKIENLYLTKPLIVLTHLAVEETYRRRGIGVSLFSNLLNALGANYSYLGVGWQNLHGWDAEKIVLKHDFEVVAIKELFWHTAKDEDGLYCPYCGNNCKCSAKIVVKR